MQGSVRQRRVGQLKGRNEKKIKLVFVPSSPTVDRENSQPDQFNLRTPTKTPKVSNGSSPLTSNSSAKSQESWTKLQTNWDKIVDNSVREICIPTKAKVTYSNRVRSVQAVSDEENVDQGFSSADEGGTVPVKVKNMHLLLEQGVSKRYKDELTYILDGLLQPKLGIKRSAMMDLLRKSTDPEFLKACRMHNIMDNINPEEVAKDAITRTIYLYVAFVTRKECSNPKEMLDWTLKELEYTLQIDILTNLPTKKHDRVLCLEISELVSNLGLSKDTTSILVEMAADFIALDKISAPTMEPSKKLLAHLQKRYLDLDIECNSTHYITILISYFSRGKQADLSSIVEIMFKRIQCMLTSEVYSKKIMANTLSTLINVSGLHMFVDHSFAEDIIGGILLKVQSISDEIDSEIVDLKLLAVGLLNNLVQDNIPLAKHLCSLGISNCCLQIKCKCISKKRLPKKTKLSVDTILFPHILVNLINDGLSGHDQADFNGQTLFTCILLTNLISIQPHLILSIKSALTGSSFDNVIDVLEQYLAFRDMVGSMEGLEDFAAKDDKAVRIVRKLLKFLHEI